MLYIYCDMSRIQGTSIITLCMLVYVVSGNNGGCPSVLSLLSTHFPALATINAFKENRHTLVRTLRLFLRPCDVSAVASTAYVDATFGCIDLALFV